MLLRSAQEIHRPPLGDGAIRGEHDRKVAPARRAVGLGQPPGAYRLAERPQHRLVTSRITEKESKARPAVQPRQDKATAIVSEDRTVGARYRGPLNPRSADSAKRIGHEADDPVRQLGEKVHGVLATELDRLRRAEGKEPPHLAAPPTQVVDVVDAGVDQHAAARGPRDKPPARVLAVSASDKVDCAQ